MTGSEQASIMLVSDGSEKIAATNISDKTLIERARAYSQAYMSQPHFDNSHDFNHILRVLALSNQLLFAEQRLDSYATYNKPLIIIGALLHDVGDRKYLVDGDKGGAVSDFLLSAGANPSFAQKVQQLVDHVSFSKEKKDPEAVQELLKEMPELGIVQDADRLDAIGAVGIGRCFTYNGAKSGGSGKQAAIGHFVHRLEAVEPLMKTTTGRALAKERTEKLRLFRSWWDEETKAVLAPVE